MSAEEPWQRMTEFPEDYDPGSLMLVEAVTRLRAEVAALREAQRWRRVEVDGWPESGQLIVGKFPNSYGDVLLTAGIYRDKGFLTMREWLPLPPTPEDE